MTTGLLDLPCEGFRFRREGSIEIADFPKARRKTPARGRGAPPSAVQVRARLRVQHRVACIMAACWNPTRSKPPTISCRPDTRVHQGWKIAFDTWRPIGTEEIASGCGLPATPRARAPQHRSRASSLRIEGDRFRPVALPVERLLARLKGRAQKQPQPTLSRGDRGCIPP